MPIDVKTLSGETWRCYYAEDGFQATFLNLERGVILCRTTRSTKLTGMWEVVDIHPGFTHSTFTNFVTATQLYESIAQTLKNAH